MDFDSQTRQLKQKFSEETRQRINKVDSEILMREEEIKELNKSIVDTLPEINALNAELAQLENNLSVETKGAQLITTSNKDLSSRLAQVIAQLEKKLEKHQANLDNACARKKLLSQKVPSTDITKLLEAQADETISAEQVAIQKVTQASKHLTDQVTDLQSQLESGTLNLKTHRQKISEINCDIRLCKQKLSEVELDQESYLSELKSVRYSLETSKQCKEHLLSHQELLRRSFEVAKPEDDSEPDDNSEPEDDSEPVSIKSSIQPENQQPQLEIGPSPDGNLSLNLQMLEVIIRKLQEDNKQMRSRLEVEMQVKVERLVQEHMQQWEFEANAREEAREREWQRKMNDINSMLRKLNGPHAP